MPTTLKKPTTKRRKATTNEHWNTSEAYTLVVVDMQSKYPAANDPAVIGAVEQEILDAIRLKMPIIFLEYLSWRRGVTLRDMPPTHERLTDHVKFYPHVELGEKWRDDGSDKVLNICNERRFVQTRFRIVGVNTDVCVRATVEGLNEAMPKSIIEVIVSACNTDQATDSKEAWRWLPRGLGNITAIP